MDYTYNMADSENACESKCERRTDRIGDEYVLAFDTANEVIAIGVGILHPEDKTIECIASLVIEAHRASNTQLLPQIDKLFEKLGIGSRQIACVCVGRGPGSFTGVRIAMATAKGISTSLGCSLVGVSTQDAVAYGAWSKDVRGRLLVLGDAMRKEVYPAFYDLSDEGIERLSSDRVVKAADFAEEGRISEETQIAGDALSKYMDLVEGCGTVLDESLWVPSGEGMLLTLQSLWRDGTADPFDAKRHSPMSVLPIYTRLSDAEENERARIANPDKRDLITGVQGDAENNIEYRPFSAHFADSAKEIERYSMETDAWNAAMFVDELGRKDRTWWMALRGNELVGYAGGMLVDGDMQILKIAVHPEARRSGIAKELVFRLAYDAENLAARTFSLEVRKSNAGAQGFYAAMGFVREGERPRYYSDGESAVIMKSSISDVLEKKRSFDIGQYEQDDISFGEGGIEHPLILAIESSCDETAASVIDGSGRILSSVVASQIDFHARFGGVVPEIASRKHVEAISGVCQAALEDASGAAQTKIAWDDLNAIGVTYAPGLVGALVVGVAFAKGAAWAMGIPIIGVNHLEGHLYANKLAEGEGGPFEPPAVVSLLSGGNTMLVHMKDWQDYEVLGQTIDDAVGEAFDKVAKALGLPYPGGPAISKLAQQGDPDAVEFPRALLHSGDYRFSLSGLKTAVLVYINKKKEEGAELNLPDICASFQEAVVDVQVAKARTALEETGAMTFCLGGGVAANPRLREAYESMCCEMGVRVLMPPLSACGDNAAMIALVALDRYKQDRFFDLSADAYAHADLSQPY